MREGIFETLKILNYFKNTIVTIAYIFSVKLKSLLLAFI